ncbi:MAG: hypothetical protein Kow0065_14960 [Methylomicrobium sp.]
MTSKKLWVAIDAWQNGELLELAVSLAKRQHAQLTALLVEDIDLFRLAGLPFATEVDRVTSAELKFDADRVDSASSRRIERIRQRLTDLAKQAELTISLSVVRGHYLDEAIAAAAQTDLLLLDRPRVGRSTRFGKRFAKKYVPPVWSVYDGSEAARRALSLAVEIAVSQQAGLNIILQASSDSDDSELERSAKAVVAEANVVRHFFVQSSQHYDAILHYVLQRGCSMVLMRADGTGEVPARTVAAMFAERVGCPVLLVA